MARLERANHIWKLSTLALGAVVTIGFGLNGCVGSSGPVEEMRVTRSLYIGEPNSTDFINLSVEDGIPMILVRTDQGEVKLRVGEDGAWVSGMCVDPSTTDADHVFEIFASDDDDGYAGFYAEHAGFGNNAVLSADLHGAKAYVSDGRRHLELNTENP
jgi:hypothetical protein